MATIAKRHYYAKENAKRPLGKGLSSAQRDAVYKARIAALLEEADRTSSRTRASANKIRSLKRRIKEMSHEIQLLDSARKSAQPVLHSRSDVRADSARYTESVRPGNVAGHGFKARSNPAAAVYGLYSPEP